MCVCVCVCVCVREKYRQIFLKFYKRTRTKFRYTCSIFGDTDPQ